MKQDEIYLQHIFDAISSIEDFISNLTENEFLKDLKTQYAVIRDFEIIGEAVKNVSYDLKIKSPKIPWKKAADLRNSLIHEYFDVDLPALWNTIQKDLPVLKRQIEELLEDVKKLNKR